MSTVDIVILCLVALPTVVGVFYGFLNILFSLLSWAVSLGLSVKLVPYFSPLLENYVNTPILRDALAFIALFILSLLVMTGISYFLVKLLGSAGLTAADRILGLFFGMGLGGLIVTVIIFMAGFTALPQEVWWEESKLASPFERISIWSSRFLPESINANLSYVQANEDN